MLSAKTENRIRALNRKIEKLLEDKNGKLYRDNVVRFCIPGGSGEISLGKRDPSCSTSLSAHTQMRATDIIN